jgi:cellulose synthase/poly-beta-1,6-N-acetylglucosamine synthase-like glycosyltransferase
MCRYSVAVIIPCYNSSKNIETTINSVLDQDYENLEIDITPYDIAKRRIKNQPLVLLR